LTQFISELVGDFASAVIEEIVIDSRLDAGRASRTAYLVLTRYWRNVDADLDGIPDEMQAKDNGRGNNSAI